MEEGLKTKVSAKVGTFEADCDNCGTVFDIGDEVFDSDGFRCPRCSLSVVATVDEDGSVYWNTFDEDGEQI